jgi:hypothetical protein
LSLPFEVIKIMVFPQFCLFGTETKTMKTNLSIVLKVTQIATSYHEMVFVCLKGQ